eukprot:Protomagalhaensia_wolfi_Nauph_80__3460@NODE_350_length_2709_cov_34_365169_g263_i0_p2_GENE_NODE_350_length_2709_cov_34_365169_g263_i0NODE_350_length_2709_cov_34_365169_g263_i0_p2_ORF_typecomplete_len272_score47_02BPL_LplA_LipB/PF03099_19/8_3e08BPL_LplA_LipB_2/PF16917_5/0_0077BPL_LplA_LipB_2/PF16917_5/2_2e02_NODE_350_length_2709_cov_34_365169_g263_i013142129
MKHLHIPIVPSTYTHVCENVATLLQEDEAVLVTTDHQPRGIGRIHDGKPEKWIGEKNNVFAAALVPIKVSLLPKPFSLPMVLGVVIMEALANEVEDKDQLQMKLINDLFYRGRKVCGILCQLPIHNGKHPVIRNGLEWVSLKEVLEGIEDHSISSYYAVVSFGINIRSPCPGGEVAENQYGTFNLDQPSDLHQTLPKRILEAFMEMTVSSIQRYNKLLLDNLYQPPKGVLVSASLDQATESKTININEIESVDLQAATLKLKNQETVYPAY